MAVIDMSALIWISKLMVIIKSIVRIAATRIIELSEVAGSPIKGGVVVQDGPRSLGQPQQSAV
jgi:hypothetical protein